MLSKIDKKRLLDASVAANESNLTEFKVKIIATKEDCLIDNFLRAVETVKLEDESQLPSLVVEVYNQFAAEQTAVSETSTSEEDSPTTEEKEDSPTTEEKGKEEKSVYVRRLASLESRPAMLRRKIHECGIDKVTLESVLQDKELLEKYKNNKNWIKIDFNRIIDKE